MAKPTMKPPVKVRHHTVLDIIEACKKAGVTHFKDGNLEISFIPETHDTIIKATEKPTEPLTPQELKETAKPSDEELFTLMVADPIAFEEQMQKDLDG